MATMETKHTSSITNDTLSSIDVDVYVGAITALIASVTYPATEFSITTSWNLETKS